MSQEGKAAEDERTKDMVLRSARRGAVSDALAERLCKAKGCGTLHYGSEADKATFGDDKR